MYIDFAMNKWITNKSQNLDMLNGNLIVNLIKYAIPLALTGILQQVFNAADVAVVGNFAGEEAMSAVGSNSPVIGLLVNLFVGISLSANVVIAHASGQQNYERIEKAVHTSILVSIFGGILIATIGEIFAKPIVSAMDVPEEISDMALTYLRIYILGLPVIFLYNFESAIFRSRGNTKIPLVALVISGIINVFLNLLFVCVFKMDVDGVAWATVISNLISSSVLFVFLLKTDDKIKVSIRKLKIDFEVLSKMLKIGIPSGLQGMVFSLSNIIVQSAINSLGTTIISASTAAFNLEIFSFYVMNSFGQSCTTFVGQNFGARKNDRCRKILFTCLLLCFISTGTTCGLILLFGRSLLSIFNKNPEVISIGLVRLQVIFFAYLFSFAQENFSGYLRGFGVSAVPAISTLIGVCGTRLIWIFFVFKANPKFETIMQVYPISLGITAVFLIGFTLIMRPSKRFSGKGDL